MLLVSRQIHVHKIANTCYMQMQEIFNTCCAFRPQRGVPCNHTGFPFGPYSLKGGKAWYHNTPPKFRPNSPMWMPVWYNFQKRPISNKFENKVGYRAVIDRCSCRV